MVDRDASKTPRTSQERCTDLFWSAFLDSFSEPWLRKLSNAGFRNEQASLAAVKTET